MLAALVFAGFGSTGEAEAASGVQCGSRLTKNTVLTKDLHCKKDGLKIGAHGISLDLNGHDIIGPGLPGTKGIQNSGYDHVVINGYNGGTIRGFDRGIELRKGADDNEIVGFYVGGIRAGHYGLVMYDSDRARVDDNFITAGAKADGYDGGFGAAYALYRSHDHWFEENYSWGNGVNVFVLDNSHRNNVGEFNFVEADNRLEVPAGLTPSRGTGLILWNSDKNQIVGNVFAENAKDGIYIDSKSTGNRVAGNLAVDNGRLGINVRSKNTDGGGNVAFGNGWSAQCRRLRGSGKCPTPRRR
ncbi:MAG TPA: NosD domain-containing protein [Acidimicrobiia bacterium]|nr:NosD domain-containing protein [Acidimicrobiia bacterium]